LWRWADARNGTANAPDIYATLVGADGLPEPSGGFALRLAAGSQSAPTVAFDGEEFLVAWQEYRGAVVGSSDIYGARVGAQGTLYSRNPILIDTNAYSQLVPATTAVGSQRRFLIVSQGLLYAAPRTVANWLDLNALRGSKRLVCWLGTIRTAAARQHGRTLPSRKLGRPLDLGPACRGDQCGCCDPADRCRRRHAVEAVLPGHPTAMKSMLLRLRTFVIVTFAAALPVAGQVIKVACIGDSITEGAGVDTPTLNAYPVVLGRLLGTNYQTRNFGVSGRTLLRRGDYPYWNESGVSQRHELRAGHRHDQVGAPTTRSPRTGSTKTSSPKTSAT